jgi:GlpG protein
MRQIATLPDEPLAQRFADYLLTMQIHTQLIPEGEQVGVWVRDEDKLGQAKAELEGFLKAPNDARYGKASAVARSIRHEEDAKEKEYQRRQRRFSEIMGNIGLGERPVVTISLLLISVGVTLASNFAQPLSSPLAQAMFIQSVRMAGGDMYFVPTGMTDVTSGQVWRLFTPMFLHMNPLHLGFNMLMLYQLGGAVEASRGRLKFLLLVLVLAASSNVAQFYCHIALDKKPWIDFALMPMFGGMSGVIYGLFGYAWMKSKYEPELGLMMPPQNVYIMLGWFVLCLVGAVGPVANTAHGVGMLAGMLIGLAPLAWRRR